MTQTSYLPRSSVALDYPEPPQRRRTWTPMLLTQLVLIVAVLVAGVTGAALRGGEESEDVLSVVQAASTTAAAQKTMRATYEIRLSGAGIDVTSTGTMVTDNARRLASGTLSAPGLGEIEVRSIAGVGYMQLPNGQADASGHHWLSYSVLKPGATVGTQDPLAMLRLVGNPESVEDAGDEQVNGVQTAHYRVHMDPARLQTAIADSGVNITVPPDAFKEMKDAVSEVWIDEDNLPRRMAMSLRIQQVTSSYRFDFFDYGKPVEVVAPDSSDVTEVASPLEVGKLLSGIKTS